MRLRRSRWTEPPLRANTSLILTCTHISGDLVKMGILVQGRYELCDSAGLINSQEEADSAGPGPHSKEQLESLSGGMVLKELIKVLIPHLTFKTPLGGTPPKDP